MDCSCLALLSCFAHCVGSRLCISDTAVLFSLQGCMRWEDEMVWTRLDTQIDAAARLMKICSEHAGRKAVQYIGMCHNALLPQPCTPSSSLTLSHSSLSSFAFLLIKLCFLLSGSLPRMLSSPSRYVILL